MGIDLSRSKSLFGRDWDRCAREMGHRLRSLGMTLIVRGPGSDHPLGALDAFVVEQVRTCHERAIAAAMHYGAERYVVRLDGTTGRPRSERMARAEATSRMLEQLAVAARARGMELGVEQHLEHDPDALEGLVETLGRIGAGLIYSPALAVCSEVDDVAGGFELCRPVIIGLDLTDRLPRDLEPRAPGSGVLDRVDSLASMMNAEEVGFFTLDVPRTKTAEAVEGLNGLARRVAVGPELA